MLKSMSISSVLSLKHRKLIGNDAISMNYQENMQAPTPPIISESVHIQTWLMTYPSFMMKRKNQD